MTEKESNHFLDLKLPLGALLSFYGVVLGLYGIFSDPSVYTKSFHINVNLYWGGLLLALGLLLLLLTFRRRRG